MARYNRAQSRYALARVLNRQTLAIEEEVLGKTHPDTLMSGYCLAHVLPKRCEIFRWGSESSRECQEEADFVSARKPQRRDVSKASEGLVLLAVILVLVGVEYISSIAAIFGCLIYGRISGSCKISKGATSRILASWKNDALRKL
ncbi:uncharacterized protein RSE6_14273 [Rhynchosporium secalis]|uniref:Uncharacterized protein n=1 Tax=Rhynchosporium secalis TaxID=38038 RepID=A0A1E1MUW3_RHYSE|nr:uncharacterized protein RSE6_14273 [Rhynchosporium secalis]